MPRTQKNKPTSLLLQIGQRIRQRREAKGLQQAELGYLLGQSARAIAAYEAGQKKLSLSRLCRLARALDVPAGYFLDEAISPLPPMPARAPVSGQALPLLRAFMALPDDQTRQQAIDYVLSL